MSTYLKLQLHWHDLMSLQPSEYPLRFRANCIIISVQEKGRRKLRASVSRPMLERLPIYVSCLEKMIKNGIIFVSAAKIAKELNFGEVQFRKELSVVSGAGKPRVGYDTRKLLSDLRSFIGEDEPCEAVIVGAGQLGCALLGYSRFEDVGVRINTAFDISERTCANGKKNCALEQFLSYCENHSVQIGIITVPAKEAQSVCDMMLRAGIKAKLEF